MLSFIQNVSTFLKIAFWTFRFQSQALGWFRTIHILVKYTYDNIQTLLYSFFLGQLINNLVQTAGTGFDQSIINPLIGIVIVWAVGEGLYTNGYLVNFTNHEKVRMIYNQSIIKKMIELDWQRIESPDTEKKIRNVLDQGSWPIHTFVDSMMFLVTVIIGFIFAMFTVKLSLVLVLALLVGAVPAGLQSLWYSYVDANTYEKLSQRYTKLAGLMDFFQSFNTLFESKVSQADKYLMEVETRERANNIQMYVKNFSKLTWTELITKISSLSSDIFVLWFLVRQVIFNGLGVGTFQFYFTTFNKLRNDIKSIFSSFGQIEESFRYIHHFYSLVHLQPSLTDGTDELDQNDEKTISFSAVSFKYPDSENYALREVTVTIKPGQKIALVGENGAGKSSFVKLLLRAYDPSSGEITIGGKPLPSIKKKTWYQNLSFLPQDFARYDVLSVAENISLRQTTTPNEVQKAAFLANANGFVNQLPQKYETLLTRKLEGGTELSSGQWQKLALSRLFFQEKPIVIMDEPTAAIDPVSEFQIFENVYQTLANKTVILVSHRYSTVKSADLILVFKDGEIIERGTYQQLISKNGYFAKAQKLQETSKELGNSKQGIKTHAN